MADNYRPTTLTLDQQKATLTTKIGSLENDRLQFGIETDALKMLGDAANEADRAKGDQYAHEARVLDARIAAHQAVLDRIDAELAASGPPAAISAQA